MKATNKMETRNIDELIPYQNNTRTHDKKQITKIRSSLREFGFVNPVLIDAKNGIIAGHGRVMAAREEGITEIPCVLVEHLTEAQKKAYIIADNRLALDAGWDEELLKIELDGLNELDFDLALTGFDEKELNALLNSGETAVEDDFDMELPEDPISKRGDIWLLGRHRLMCGDSMGEDVAALMDGKKAGMVFTDPPYGVEYQSNRRPKNEKFEVIKNDDVELDIVPVIEKYSAGWVFIWTSWKVIDKWIAKTQGLGYPSNIIVWAKGGGGIGDLKKTFTSDYEVALVFNRGAELCGKRVGSVWSIGKDSPAKYKHPTQKPVGLAYEAIDKTSKNGSRVLDLFGGSGSTLIAAEQLNRLCYMMELDEKYVDVIKERYIAFKNSDDDVFLIREGVTYSHKDVLEWGML